MNFRPLQRFSDRISGVPVGSGKRATESEQNQPLKVLWDTGSDKNAIDIVAVHGLARGFKSWSWEDDKNCESWLEEPLRKEFQKKGINARMMTFSYDPHALSLQYLVRKVLHGQAFNLLQLLKSERSASTPPERPLVFIAHSLGGLIVKRALIIASESADVEFRSIELSTGGIFFFGTPDTSVSVEKLEQIIRKIAKLSRNPRKIRKEERISVRNDTQWLKEELEPFKAISCAMSIVTARELIPTSFSSGTLKSGLIVDRTSAQRPSASTFEPDVIQLDRRHTSLVKFRGANDKGFRSVINRLTFEIKENVFNHVREKWEKYREAGTILDRKQNDFPFSSDLQVTSLIPGGAKIMARKEIALQIDETLSKAKSDGHVPIVAVCGPNGVGKSTVVRHYSEKARDNQRFVYWLNAESRQTICTGFLTLGQHIFSYYWNKYYSAKEPNLEKAKALLRGYLGLPDIDKLLAVKDFESMDPIKIKSAVKAVKNWLLRDGNQWLLVYENVGDKDSFDLLEYLPLTVRGEIILITQESNRCPWSFSDIHIPEWTVDEAAALLISELRVSDYETDSTDEEFALTKSIVTALDRNPLSISCAAAFIVKQKPKLSLLDYWNKLSKEEDAPTPSIAGISEPALQILGVSAMLAVRAIPVDLFVEGLNHQNSNTTDSGEVSIGNIVSELADQSFLQHLPPSESESPQDEKLIFLNETTRLRAQKDMQDDPTKRADYAKLACLSCVQVIKRNYNDSSLVQIQSFGRLMLPHVKRCGDLVELMDEEAKRAIEWNILGHLCMTQGATSTAVAYFNKALNVPSLTIFERTQIHLEIANVYYNRKDLSECRARLDDIERQKPWSKDDNLFHDLKFWVQFTRAEVTVLDKAELQKAAQQFNQLEKDEDEFCGPGDPKTLLALNGLATTLTSLGELERAETLYRRIMTSYRMIYGASDPMTLEAMERLAQVFELQGDFEEALNHYQESLSLKKNTLGPDHPSSATTMACMALLYDRRHDFAKADDLYAISLPTLEKSLGKANPTYLAVLEGQALGSLLRAKANKDDAVAEEILQNGERTLEDVVKTKKRSEAFYSNQDLERSQIRLEEVSRALRLKRKQILQAQKKAESKRLEAKREI